MNLMLYGWIKKAMKDMEVEEWDMTAEAFGMEIKELDRMDEMKEKLYYEANMEGLYGKNWM